MRYRTPQIAVLGIMYTAIELFVDLDGAFLSNVPLHVYPRAADHERPRTRRLAAAIGVVARGR